jgi:hypothetical protein
MVFPASDRSPPAVEKQRSHGCIEQKPQIFLMLLRIKLVQHPADVGEASGAFGVLGGASAGAEAFGVQYHIQDQRAAVAMEILLDIRARVAETITDHV